MVKKLQSISRVRFIYVMTTLFLMGLSIYSFYQIKSLFQSSNLMLHANQVKGTLSSISAKLFEAETNNRGFLLTGDSLMILKRDRAILVIGQERMLLDRLVKDNDAQKQHLAVLGSAINEKINSMIAISLEGNPVIIPSDLRDSINNGVRKMDVVHAYLMQMINEESDFLERRTQMFTRLSLVAPLYIIVLFLGALFILFYSYLRLNAELRQSQMLHSTLLKQGNDREALAEELIRTNQEPAFQNEEKEKRASELVIANLELGFQNERKAKLADELIIANQELAYQNEEKEKRASELVIANLELGFQNETKAKLADELIVANHELAFQNEEKEKRAAELSKANKELQLFLNISSHDLQEPLRKIQMSASRISEADYEGLSPKGRDHFVKMQEAARSMQTLIEDLLTYSRTNTEERKFETTDLRVLIDEVRDELKEAIEEKQAVFEVPENYTANVIPFQFRQLMHNLFTNALKFSLPGKPPHIKISIAPRLGSDCHQPLLRQDKEYHHITISDNGIGFDPVYNEKIFEVFQRLYGKETYKGTGIGLAIVKRIVENHEGLVTATGELNKGACFDIYIPTNNTTQHG
jgi:signal transduction histidine kinase